MGGHDFRDERGETLIELLITIIVLSIGGVAIVAMMTSAVISADTHRGMAAGEVVLRDYTEAIQDHADGLATWPACPTAAQLEPTFGPSGWPTHAITQVTYWNGSSWSTDRTTCTSRYDLLCGGTPLAGCDPGLVKLDVHVANSRAGAQFTDLKAVVYVRRNNAP